MEERTRLAQDGDNMFERNIAIIAMNSREVTVQMQNGFTVKGFIAGLDDENIQVCRSSDGKYVELNRALYLSIEESGRSFTEIEKAATSELASLIKSHISNFVNVSKAFHGKKNPFVFG